MSKNMRRKKNTAKAVLVATLIIALTAVILLCALVGATFVIAKGPAKSESDRLCATFAEKRFPFSGLFFSAEELESSLFYMPPKPAQSNVSLTGDYTTALYYIDGSSSAWDAVVITGIDPASLALAKGDDVPSSAKYSLGLAGGVDAYIIGDYLTYKGEDGELYCFCAMGEDGVLHIGAMSAYEAANSGFIWGMSADRVLISDSVPATDLGGGYSSRVAIGQAADGSVILIFANDRGIYPSGITYSELASLMFDYGAVNAAALTSEGGFYADGVGQLGSKSESAFSLIVKGGGDR